MQCSDCNIMCIQPADKMSVFFSVILSLFPVLKTAKCDYIGLFHFHVTSKVIEVEHCMYNKVTCLSAVFLSVVRTL